MIAWALVGPTPGRASNCSAVAELMLIFCPGARVPLDFPVGVSGGCDAVGPFAEPATGCWSDLAVCVDFVVFSFFAAFLGVSFVVAAVVGPKVMLSLIAFTLDWFIPLTFA